MQYKQKRSDMRQHWKLAIWYVTTAKKLLSADMWQQQNTLSGMLKNMPLKKALTADMCQKQNYWQLICEDIVSWYVTIAAKNVSWYATTTTIIDSWYATTAKNVVSWCVMTENTLSADMQYKRKHCYQICDNIEKHAIWYVTIAKINCQLIRDGREKHCQLLCDSSEKHCQLKCGNSKKHCQLVCDNKKW